MSVIQEIITCPVCKRSIGIDSRECNLCADFYTKEIKKIGNYSEHLLDLRPKNRENNAYFQENKEKTFATQLFANSVFPWFYEKILPIFWAMGLRGIGGIEKEFKETIEFFGRDPNTVMDLSCGTGIMARKLARSQFYQHIIALDYSESMLSVLRQQMNVEKIPASENFVVMRGDAESLPLMSNSLDAIYVGAAMHCWENPKKGIEEVYRVLRPGGKLFTTTFLKFLPSQNLYFFSIEELWQIFQEVGFQKNTLEIKSEGIYATIKCIKN